MPEFLTENRISIIGHFSALHLTPGDENMSNNSDQYRVTFNTADHGGQPLTIGRREVALISFVVNGPEELRELVDMLSSAYDKLIDGQGGSVEDRSDGYR